MIATSKHEFNFSFVIRCKRREGYDQAVGF